MKRTLPTAAIAAFMMGAVAEGSVLWQSDFTGNNLTDAGLAQVKFDSNSNWIINTADDRLQNDLVNGNDRASVYTIGSWGLTPSYSGFSLDVTFNQVAAGTRFAFGIVTDTFSPNHTKWVDSAGAYGIGFALSGELTGGGDALALTGSGASVLSTAQGNVTFNTLQTLSFTATADSWSYSLNGQTPTTGTFGTPFDISNSYRFIANGQRGNPSLRGSYFTNVTLTAIPEPSSTALFGLGALAFVLRRRRS